MAEQVPVDRLIDRTWEVFDMRLTSIGATYTVWGSLTTPEDLTERFFAAKGEKHLLDQRRRLSKQEENRLHEVIARSESALRYLEWARQLEGQPILQDSLVSYVSAFENTLKDIAVAFRLLELPTKKVGETCYVDVRKYHSIIDEVGHAWSRPSRGSGGRAQDFFVSEILQRNRDQNAYPFNDPASELTDALSQSPALNWALVQDAFLLRNAVIHSNGKLKQQVEIGDEVFYPRDDMRLTMKTLRRIEDSMRSILSPIDPLKL